MNLVLVLMVSNPLLQCICRGSPQLCLHHKRFHCVQVVFKLITVKNAIAGFAAQGLLTVVSESGRAGAESCRGSYGCACTAEPCLALTGFIQTLLMLLWALHAARTCTECAQSPSRTTC